MERGHLDTEARHPAAAGFDALATDEALDVVLATNLEVHAALEAARGEIARAVDEIASRLARGGRLFYVGAGTSGRLGVLDAAECPPTFLSDPDQVQGLIAGGAAALTSAVEGAEDDPTSAGRELDRRGLAAGDVVFGITAGGTTPYVHGAIAAARAREALTIFFACVPAEQASDDADLSIRVVTGPEVIAGSTRLKAGTATKLALNAISTLTMARLGKVHDNLMIDVDTRRNAKLEERGVRLVALLTGLGTQEAAGWLERAQGAVKVAVLMQRSKLPQAEARARLRDCAGSLRAALERGE